MSGLKHILLDVETLGIRENAVVLSLGAVSFRLEPGQRNDYDSYVLDGFYVKFDVKDQVRNYGRKIEEDTLNWWKRQGATAREVLKPSVDDVAMADGLAEFNAWIRDIDGFKFKDSYVWSRGTNFDFPKIESMYHQANIRSGFSTWKVRDVRTYIDILTGSDRGVYDVRETPNNFVAHHALHDAAMDAYRMVEIFNDAAG